MKYHQDIGVMTACVNNNTEETKGLGKREGKCYTKDYFVFYGWFVSNRSEYSEKDIVVDFIGLLKTINKGFLRTLPKL